MGDRDSNLSCTVLAVASAESQLTPCASPSRSMRATLPMPTPFASSLRAHYLGQLGRWRRRSKLSAGVQCLRRTPRYSLQHIQVEGSNWHHGLRRTLVKACIHHNDEIELRYDEHALPPKADCGRPLHLTPVNQRTAEPEKVAVEI
jgi:hypothetical protein